MKSAYELAMERLNKTSPTVKLTAAQKKELAELDSKYAAKVAEREIALKGEMEKAVDAGDGELLQKIQHQLADDKRKLQSDLEDYAKKYTEMYQKMFKEIDQHLSTRDENNKLTYPAVVRVEGIAPSQYGTKGLVNDKLAEVEEKYDLNASLEGFTEEGEEEGGETDSFAGGEGATTDDEL
jgi:hypothetical protein